MISRFLKVYAQRSAVYGSRSRSSSRRCIVVETMKISRKSYFI